MWKLSSDGTYGFDEILKALEQCEAEFDKASDNLLKDTAKTMKAETKSRTAIKNNVLRPSWDYGDIEGTGLDKSIEFGSNIEYGLLYEEGHKTKNGGFVTGRFPVRDSFTIVEKDFKKNCNDLIKQVMGGFRL